MDRNSTYFLKLMRCLSNQSSLEEELPKMLIPLLIIALLHLLLGLQVSILYFLKVSIFYNPQLVRQCSLYALPDCMQAPLEI